MWHARNTAVIALKVLSHLHLRREIWSFASLINLCGHVKSIDASPPRIVSWLPSKEVATLLNVALTVWPISGFHVLVVFFVMKMVFGFTVSLETLVSLTTSMQS